MRYLLFLLICVVFVRCQEPEIVPQPYQPTSAYDAYRHGLIKAGLGKSKIVKTWLNEGEDCLSTPTFIKIPHQEILFFDETAPEAFTYRLQTKRGQKIQAALEYADTLSAKVFLDLYRVIEDTLNPFVHVATSDSSSQLIEFEPQIDGEYVLRLQPEILVGGKFKLEINEVPVFQFPMAGRTESAILSVFGDPRDAGRRIHEGNDIFATRHTPIIAATSGIISYAGERGLGGKQAWLRDKERKLALYFAHLDSVYVRKGQYIERGDTIGTNGNSGNAITTNPHLHFGIYSESGAIDPYHFIVPNRHLQKELKSDTSWVGLLVRTRNRAHIDHIDERYKTKRDVLPIHTLMKVQAAWSRSYRVQLPDGRQGYVRSGDLALASDPFRTSKDSKTLLIAKAINTAPIDSITQNQRFEVLGRFGKHRYVSFEGNEGWIVAEE